MDYETEEVANVYKGCRATDRQTDRQTYKQTDRLIDGRQKLKNLFLLQLAAVTDHSTSTLHDSHSIPDGEVGEF
jgi:hypothetical protein